MRNLFAWDFHGTLEKGNEHAVKRICEAVLEKHGYYRRVTIDEVLYLYGHPWSLYFKSLVPSIPDGKIQEMVDYAVEVSKGVTHQHLRPMDHAMDVLLLLKLKGNDNIIISNSRQDRLENFVETIGIGPMITKSIGMERSHEKSNYNLVKYKAENIAKHSNGQFGKVFMIGDTESDIEAGLLAGAQTVLFNPRGNPVETKAHHTISDLRDILKLI